jgi:hypothetical protein
MDNNTNAKLDQINDRLASIDKTLAINTTHLAEHIRRTEILEKQMDPIAKHVQQMQGAGKLLAMLALIATILSAWAIFS